MATAIAATPNTAAPPRCTLSVTGAPSPPAAAYTSNFTAGVDSWAGGSGTTIARDATTTPNSLKLTATASFPPPFTVISATRTVAGLTAGAAYRLRAFVIAGNANTQARIAIPAIVGAATSYQYTDTPGAWFEVTFTAAATSHVLELDVMATAGSPVANFHTITVNTTATWQGTSIARTDANGTAPVRNPNRLDTAGGVLAITDYEAALTGSITYQVTDGAGGTATSSPVTLGAPGMAPSLTIPATALLTSSSSPPTSATLTGATSYDEASESPGTLHTVLGRADKLGNPAPLTLRAGTLELWCIDYTAAVAVRNTLRPGLTALFRQADYPGMDLYFLATSVAVSPDPADTITRHWLAAVAYSEAARP